MKHKFLLIGLCFVLVNIAKGQEQALIASQKGFKKENDIGFNYIPIANEGARWLETWYDDNLPPGPYGYNGAWKRWLEGDTMINNFEYKKIYCSHVDVFCQNNNIGQSYCGAIRDDINGKKAWIIPEGDTSEILYFDFSLSIGDTVPGSSYFCRDIIDPLVVYDIDTVITLDGIDRRQWTFLFQQITGGSSIIDGIGCINGLLYPFLPPDLPFGVNLYCFTIDSVQVYPFHHSTCILPSDTCLTTGINNNYLSGMLKVFPNPVRCNQEIFVTVPASENDQIITYKLYDLYGSSILYGNSSDNVFKFKTPNLKRGLYILTIVINNKRFNIKLEII